MYDIEAHLLDTEAAPFGRGRRGEFQPGEPLRGMWLRLTVDTGTLLVEAREASSDRTPCALCPQKAPASARWSACGLGLGFNRAVVERVGRVKAAPASAGRWWGGW